ncbi:MAG: hypothetical protein F2842_06565 [Actinobacteria bacterium]|uniref:Unannotated protein n=1 Tax=freshwater metagenome TaxID=449393 RepID=A0A6J7K3I7_9ZZZZ|nr:hypothetical protein [Actinomycetota bacterium]
MAVDLRSRWRSEATAQHRADEATLRRRGGFDADWYCAVIERSFNRRGALRHYLLVGAAQGIPPHPLFDAHHFVESGGTVLDGVDAFAHYLRSPEQWRVSTHGLFDTGEYVDREPASLKSRGGPPQHYLRHGLPRGVPPHDLWPTPSTLLGCLTRWVRAWSGIGAVAPVEPSLDPGTVLVLVRRGGRVARVRTLVASLEEVRRPSDPALDCWLTTAGLPLAASLRLAAIAESSDVVQVLVEPEQATWQESWESIARASAARLVVVLDPDVLVRPGWLSPLVGALESPTVAAAAAVVMDRGGSVRSAGVTFCAVDGSPQMVLGGFAAEDVPSPEFIEVSALSGGAVALRRDDLLATGRFNLRLRGGLQLADFTLRLAEGAMARSLVVVPESRVVFWGEADGDSLVSRPMDLSRFMARWANRVPRLDERVWRMLGWSLTHEPDVGQRPLAGHALSRLREAKSSALRWAIKNPAPPFDRGERWGDTHFARDLAAALRRLGEEVVIDAAPAFDRSAASIDNVALLVRGIRPWTPTHSQVSLLWVISHPDEVLAAEAGTFDRVLAASAHWGAELGASMLLQATDPALFHPDMAAPDSGPEVLFVGGARASGRPMVEWAVEAGLPLAVYGPGWEDLLPEGAWRGSYVEHDRLGALYRSAGLVLCDHWSDMAEQGFVSNRLFDVLAAGGRAVSDPVSGLHAVAPDVPVVSGAEELRAVYEADRVSLFGDDVAVRARAAHVAALHSFDARARVLIDAVASVREARAGRS